MLSFAMNFIKEAFPTTVEGQPGFRYVLRTNTHGHSLAFFKRLQREIFRDFNCEIPEDELEIVHYGGRSYRGTFGIEFILAGEKHPAYDEISRLELKL